MSTLHSERSQTARDGGHSDETYRKVVSLNQKISEEKAKSFPEQKAVLASSVADKKSQGKFEKVSSKFIGDAPNQHGAAISAHEKAATAQDAIGNHEAAQAHRDAASYHREAVSHLANYDHGTNTDVSGYRDALKSAREASAKAKSLAKGD